jgi:large subunit ribosomal protein L7/L12
MSTKAFEKIVDQIGELKVTELAELVKALKERFEVEMPVASVGVAAAASSEAPAKAEEKSEYKVTLKESGANKMGVIKALRQVTTLGLTEAKKAAEEAPTVLGDAVAKADALKMKQALEEAGAKVELS